MIPLVCSGAWWLGPASQPCVLRPRCEKHGRNGAPGSTTRKRGCLARRSQTAARAAASSTARAWPQNGAPTNTAQAYCSCDAMGSARTARRRRPENDATDGEPDARGKDPRLSWHGGRPPCLRMKRGDNAWMEKRLAGALSRGTRPRSVVATNGACVARSTVAKVYS